MNISQRVQYIFAVCRKYAFKVVEIISSLLEYFSASAVYIRALPQMTGVLADWYWQKGKFVPYVGTTIGGGMETSFYLFEGDKHDWELEQKSVLHKQPFFAIDPYVGIEYVVGEALRLTLKADWLLAVNSDGLNRPIGPRIYFGFIFAH